MYTLIGAFMIAPLLGYLWFNVNGLLLAHVLLIAFFSYQYRKGGLDDETKKDASILLNSMQASPPVLMIFFLLMLVITSMVAIFISVPQFIFGVPFYMAFMVSWISVITFFGANIILDCMEIQGS